MKEEKSPKVRITSQDWSGGDIGPCACTISGLSKKELEKVIGMVNSGDNWITTNDDGRLQIHPRRQELPAPTEDTMLPFWSPENRTDLFVKEKKRVKFEPLSEYASPNIYISSLCGYSYTPESYKENAKRLESYGFECMRSRRGPDAMFWEVWFLPGLSLAEGNLAKAIRNKNGKKKVEEAVKFLCLNVSFGSLDISVQRACMPIPE